MKVLVVCRPAPDADGAKFAALVPDEADALRALRAEGALLEAWSPGRPGAVLILDVADPDRAADVVARLPLAAAGLLATELFPLHPIDL